jgi:DNA-binding beta-propeller fold protein YncE
MPDCDSYILTNTVQDTCGWIQTASVTIWDYTWVTGISTFSARGQLPGEHRLPMDVAVDREDFVWVVDTQNKRIQKYTARGQFLFEFGDHTTGQSEGVTFGEPIAAAVDGQNRLLVLDRQTQDIQRFDENGVFIDRLGATAVFQHPEGLAVDAAGRIYVADTLNNRVQVLSPDGTPVLVFGTEGAGPGQVHHPTGVSVDPDFGNILVTDAGNDRIEVFEASGLFATAFGTSGSDPDSFNHPYEAVVGHGRSLFATDMQNDRGSWRTLFGMDANLVSLLPPERFKGKYFKHPHGLAVDSHESVVYVADTGNNRIVAIPIRRVPDTTSPRALVVSPSASVTVTGVVDVRGIAADAYFAQYTLEAGAGDTPEAFAPVAVSSTPVWGDSLGSWDTTNLAPGPYTLRLTVVDASGNTTVATVTVIVAGSSLIVSASALPASFMADRAGPQLAYQLARPATVTVMIMRPNSNHPLWVSEAAASGYGGMAGANTMAWNGRDDHGQPVEPGSYVAMLVASSGGRTERRTIPIQAILSPEAQAAGMAGPGLGGGGAHPTVTAAGPAATSAAVGSVSTGGAVASVSGGSSIANAGSGVATGSSGASSAATAASSSSDTHDNGMGNGKNPKGFVRGSNPGEHKGQQQ